MTRRPPSLYDDLIGLELSKVQAMYKEVLDKVKTTDAKVVDLQIKKRIHSDTIQFAVNKRSTAPSDHSKHADELINLAIQQKNEFDTCLRERDMLVDRLSVSRHHVANTLSDFFDKLTTQASNRETPTLAHEIEMFSRFFELQTMLQIYHEKQPTMSTERARRNLLETIKAVNKNDRRYAQIISKTRETSKELRKEAGRLRAFLKQNTSGSEYPMPPSMPELSERLLAGDALSMEEFASMLKHGGLTEINEASREGKTNPKNIMRKKKSKTQRKKRRQSFAKKE